MDSIMNDEGVIDQASLNQVAHKMAESVIEAATKIIANALGDEHVSHRTMTSVLSLAMAKSFERCWK